VGWYDVLIAGGGLAGVGAACAAARQGARTLLVERLEVLGGLGTSGGVGSFCFGDDTLPRGHGAVLDDIWQALADYEAIGKEHGWRVGRTPPFYFHAFDHGVLAWVLQEIAERDGVDLLMATDLVGAECEDGRVHAAILHNRSLTQRAEARVFVDCTGDGILSRHAGGEALGSEAAHPGAIPPSQMVFVHRAGRRRPQRVRREEIGDPAPKYSVWPEPDRIGLKMWWPKGRFDTATGRGYSDAGRAFRRRIPEFIRAFQQTDRGRDTAFDFSAPMFGLRDGVRIAGQYVLTAEDLRSGRRFEDAVAHGCFPLDSAAIRKDPMPPYQIPYRCLRVAGVKNLLIAGRCCSATRVALSSIRIMLTCCLMGQAAGIAAARAAAREADPEAVDPAEIRAGLLSKAGDPDFLRGRLE
jgi:hypothetical protein